MLKKTLIVVVLAILVVLLVFLATQQTERGVVVTTPTQRTFIEPVIIEEPVAQPMPPPAQTLPQPAQPLSLVPRDMQFWVNSIRAPTFYDVRGYNFIPIKRGRIKTFSGSFGPYFDANVVNQLTVLLCAEDLRVPGSPACQPVPITYRDGSVEFGMGFEEDESIGYRAFEDFFAYYVVQVNDETIATSPKAPIRTVEP